MALQLQPSQGLIAHITGACGAVLQIPASAVGLVVKAAALQAGFRKLDFSNSEQGAFAGSKAPDTHYLRTGDIHLLVNWVPYEYGFCLVEWVAYRRESAVRNITDGGAMALFSTHLEHCLSRWNPPPPPPMENPLVPPGGRPPLSYRGRIFDYSGLASVRQLAHLRNGVLPFGTWAFGWRDGAEYGPRLFMPSIGSDPGENLGVMLCAPSGSGKTYWLLQWAAAAARDGRSVFLVDVKGNMRPLLDQALAREGATGCDIVHFTTAPSEPSDRINFLSGIDCNQIDSTEALHQIAEALLPAESFKGDNPFVHQNTMRLTTGVLKLLKLIQWWMPGECVDPQGRPREGDLADLLELVQDEEQLMLRIDQVRVASEGGEDGPAYRVGECVNELAIALGGVYPTLQPDAAGEYDVKPFRGGQRPPDQTYVQYMLPLINALQPFRANGVTGPRIRSFGPGRELKISQFGHAAGSRPVIALLSFRESDSKLAAVPSAWRCGVCRTRCTNAAISLPRDCQRYCCCSTKRGVSQGSIPWISSRSCATPVRDTCWCISLSA